MDALTPTPSWLSPRSIIILRLIAAGHTYDQILKLHPTYTYPDIFAAAAEALHGIQSPSHTSRTATSSSTPASTPAPTLRERREKHRRSHESWSPDEDFELQSLIEANFTVARISRQLERSRGAIRARIIKLHLIASLSPKEQARLSRLTGHPLPPRTT